MTGKCALCLRKEKLIRKSHIYPNFMYNGMYNEKHQVHLTNHDELHTDKHKILQTGIFDKYILCYTCEREVLSSKEKYGSQILWGSKNEEYQVKSKRFKTDIEYDEISNVDYRKFKLFLLSILWKASISNLEHFKEVSLGPHEEVMRRMILDNEICKPDKYPVTMIRVADFSKPIKGMISTIRRMRIKDSCNSTAYIFVAQSMIFFYGISQYGMPELINLTTIKEDNTLKIPLIPFDLIDGWFEKWFGLSSISRLC